MATAATVSATVFVVGVVVLMRAIHGLIVDMWHSSETLEAEMQWHNDVRKRLAKADATYFSRFGPLPPASPSQARPGPIGQAPGASRSTG